MYLVQGVLRIHGVWLQLEKVIGQRKDDQLTVEPPSSRTRRSLLQCPILEIGQRRDAYVSCGELTRARARCCTSKVYKSICMRLIQHVPVWLSKSTLALKLIQSARTLASAHRLVRGGRIAVEPNMICNAEYASW